MKPMKLRLVAVAYLNARYRVIVGFSLFLALFWLLFLLFRLPFDAMWYGSLILLAGGLGYGGYDLYRFYSRHRAFIRLRDEITISLDRLAPPRTLLEEDQQALIRILFDDRAKQISKANAAYADRMDYDTLWAHQIKTPIAAMRLVLQGMEPTQARMELEQALFQIEQYVEMTLHYLRLQNDASDLLFRRVDLFSMVRTAVKKIRHDLYTQAYHPASDRSALYGTDGRKMVYLRSGTAFIQFPQVYPLRRQHLHLSGRRGGKIFGHRGHRHRYPPRGPAAGL